MTQGDSAAAAGQEAREHFDAGRFCAEAVLVTLGKDRGIPTESLTAIATAFCSGLSQTANTCGAVSGAIMALSLKYGRPKPDESVAAAYDAAKAFVRDFEAEFGSINCAELLGCHLGTPEGQDVYKARHLGKTHCRLFTGRAAEIAARLLDGPLP